MWKWKGSRSHARLDANDRDKLKIESKVSESKQDARKNILRAFNPDLNCKECTVQDNSPEYKFSVWNVREL